MGHISCKSKKNKQIHKSPLILLALSSSILAFKENNLQLQLSQKFLYCFLAFCEETPNQVRGLELETKKKIVTAWNDLLFYISSSWVQGLLLSIQPWNVCASNVWSTIPWGFPSRHVKWFEPRPLKLVKIHSLGTTNTQSHNYNLPSFG